MSRAFGLGVPQPIRIFLVGERLASLEPMLVESSDIEISGIAKNGKEALVLISKQNPQVICTELEMPVMDSLDLTRGIMATDPRPILVVSWLGQQEDRDKTLQLFEAGAIEVFPLLDSDSERVRYANAYELIKKIKILSGVMVFRRRQILPVSSWVSTPSVSSEPSQELPGIVVIGASTGGPPALKEILTQLPDDFSFPIVCIQHICQGFLQGLVDWLAVDCSLTVSIAQAGEMPQAGTVYFPPEHRHLKFDADGRFVIVNGSRTDDHIPSVTVSFQSAAYRFGSHVIAVLLTGMGEDGAEGMLSIAEQGGITIAQNEQSCVVFGMPHRAIEAKAASHILPLEDIAFMLISTVVKYSTRVGDEDFLQNPSAQNSAAGTNKPFET